MAYRKANIVYVVSAGDFIKIGITRHLQARIDALKTGCPLPIVPQYYTSLDSEDESRQVEGDAHKHFYKSRVRGEWFNAEILQDAIQFISRHELVKRKALRAVKSELIRKYNPHAKRFAFVIECHNPEGSGRRAEEYLIPLDLQNPLKSECVLIATEKEEAKRIEVQWVRHYGMSTDWLLERFPITKL
jgi:hypothetical protein